MRFLNADAGPSRFISQAELPVLPERVAVAHLDHSNQTKRRPIPKVAVYVSGAAFAITVGLTLLVLPYARQASKLARPPKETFHTNRYLIERRHPSSDREHHLGSRAISTDLLSKQFNAREETALFGSPLSAGTAPPSRDGETEGVSPLLGFQALGIATTLVGSMAALGAWGVAWALGVRDMEGFSAAMRDGLASRMPSLVDKVNRPSGDTVTDNWIEGAAAALTETETEQLPS